MSAAEFQQSVINYSWAPIKTHKIHANGYCSLKEPYVLDGGSYANYYFEIESTVKSISASPPILLCPVFSAVLTGWIRPTIVSSATITWTCKFSLSRRRKWKSFNARCLLSEQTNVQLYHIQTYVKSGISGDGRTHNTDFQELWGRYPQ